eukprot:71678-Pyramimonas_sp.AAC.3
MRGEGTYLQGGPIRGGEREYTYRADQFHPPSASTALYIQGHPQWKHRSESSRDPAATCGGGSCNASNELRQNRVYLKRRERLTVRQPGVQGKSMALITLGHTWI